MRTRKANVTIFSCNSSVWLFSKWNLSKLMILKWKTNRCHSISLELRYATSTIFRVFVLFCTTSNSDLTQVMRLLNWIIFGFFSWPKWSGRVRSSNPNWGIFFLGIISWGFYICIIINWNHCQTFYIIVQDLSIIKTF